ncbi:MAG: RsiV family protein [Flavobacteriales bacterium]|nr:RsiV family protein [Flavobacteriales bacterium]
MGGAHGNGGTYYYNFTVPDGRILTLKELFHDINQLNTIAEQYFRKQHMNGDLSADFDEYAFEFENNQFSLNENFKITPDGLKIQYNAYEIGPYVLGAPLVEIPWKNIQPILKKNLTVVSY